jgi:hypothetical protein
MEWWPLLLLLGVLGSIGWVIIAAGTVMEKGEGMDRSERIAQLYGYTVCLIAIVVFIASANSFVQSAFEYANPFSGNPWSYGAGQVLTSFDSYKATYDLTLPGQKPAPAISDAEMHARYDALRADRDCNTTFYRSLALASVANYFETISLMRGWSPSTVLIHFAKGGTFSPTR